MVFSTAKFQSLSIRPPTPPKDLEDNDKDADEVLDFLSDPFGTQMPAVKVIATKPLLNTPEQSPSSEGAIPSSSASRKKKVNFQPQPCTIPNNGLAPRSFTPLHSSPLRPLPQTRVFKPLKSILKPSDAASTPPPADQSAPAHKYKSFAEMLESIMKQLASPGRSSRFDAYHSLHRTMQAYEKLPDTQALVDKMGLLTQFIERDIQAIGINGTGLDSQLIGQVLKLLMALVRLPELRSAMSDDFCNFLVDRIIQVAADEAMPKLIVNHHLALLMQQTFRPRTMTPARVEKILDVLDTIQERVTGLSVLAYRIRIYRKLIQQRPEIMTKHTERWFRHTVKALLSNQKDINQSALDTTISAAKSIGTDRQVLKSVIAFMNRQKSDGDTFAKLMAIELEKMLSTDHAVMVPQIWAAVTALLLGSLQQQTFPALAEWLRVFEKCYQCTNDSVKVQTNIAFGFLIYAVNVTEHTVSTWSKFLPNVIQPQLQRRGQWKKPEREAATSGYFTLLYYALGPLASQKQLDRYWIEFVAEFWKPLLRSSPPVHAFAACRVVSALLNGARKPWDQLRALDLRPQAMMQREELPLLDPKWVRKSLSLILNFVETLLDTTPWTADEHRDEPAKTMWLSLLQSLNAASSQEVMASSESKDAMAHIVNLLRRIWDNHAAELALSQQKEDSWADKFCFLLESVVEQLSALQFADKCLTRNGQDEFEVAPTPSHRSRQHGPRISPLIYFVDLLVNQSEGKLSDTVRLRAMKLLIEPCYRSQNTRLSRLELLRDCSAIVDPFASAAIGLDMWAQVAALTKACIKDQPSDSNERVSRQLGREYDLVVEILSLGSPHLLQQPQGLEALLCFTDTVRREAGEGAVVLAVIEKVSECIVKRVPEGNKSCGLSFLSNLLRNLPRMIVRRTIEQGRQNLWPSSPNPGRNPDFDPYQHLYKAVVSIGFAAYAELQNDTGIIGDFISALAGSIRQCPIALLVVYMRKVQETIRLWIEDPDKKLQKKDQQSRDLHAQVANLWKEVCAAIERLPRKDGQILLHLEPLITAGFLSRRRDIVNFSIATWNATFGKEETLRYPARLEESLRRLRNQVELSLPSLDVREDHAGSEISFYDSDNGPEDSRHQLHSPRVKESPFRIAKSIRNSRSPAMPGTGSKKIPTRQTPKVRLRHENSQIHFEPILSSPSNPFNQESQILTERQKEMIERRKNDSNLFANMASTSSPTRQENAPSVQSPVEIHSDALAADDLPVENSRTPLKRLPPVGPMDVFVGSSPTPSARNRSQQVVSDQTSVATPTAVRSVRLANDVDELGSSPPQFERSFRSNALDLVDNSVTENIVSDSFEHQQPGRSDSISFDDGTTVDEDAMYDAVALDATKDQTEDYKMALDVDVSEAQSPTLDNQLTAQFDADMLAQREVSPGKQDEDIPQESVNVFVDAASHQPPSETVKMDNGDDTEVKDTQPELPTQSDGSALEAETSSLSRIGDSFSSQANDKESSQINNLRRSSRQSVMSSPAQPPAAKKRGRPRKNKSEIPADEAAPALSEPAPEADGMLDNIIVASPKSKKASMAKAKRSSQAPQESEIIIPGTTRKRGVRRSASLLSQAETQSEGVVIEDTPANKRLRRSSSQDVSGAKPGPQKVSQTAQVKRLKHVQITPKHAPENGSSVRGSSVTAEETVIEQAVAGLSQGVNVGEGEQNANVAPPLADDAASTRETEQNQSQQAAGGMETPNRSFAERVILTPRSIIAQLRNLKDALFRSSQLVLGRQEERDIDDALFDIRREVHAAGRRGAMDP